VGARRLSPGGADEAVWQQRLRARIDEILDGLERELRPGESLTAVSALAAGADTIFAEAVAARNLSHQVFLPNTPDAFFTEKDFFGSQDQLRRSMRLLENRNVIEVRIVSESADRRTRFSDCGYRIVHECDVLIAALPEEDLNEGGKPGGTRETLLHAEAAGRRFFRVTLKEGLPVESSPGREALPGSADEVYAWTVAPASSSDAHPEIRALKETASAMAGRHKAFFHYSSSFVLATHLTATAISVWSLADLPNGGVTRWAKPILLLAGLGIYFFLNHRKPHRDWVTARLVAELCRSVLAVRGLSGHLAYLREFHLPGCHELVRALNILHLRSARGGIAAPREFAERYLRERIGGGPDAGPGAQIEHYGSRRATAFQRRGWLETAFYAFTVVALIFATLHALSPADGQFASAGQRIAHGIVPVLFPVLAAAAASWVSVLDLDRRAELYGTMVAFLRQQRHSVDQAKESEAILVRAVHRTEHGLLQEVVEWYATHAHLRGA
jgi:hypothetical protein